MLDYLKHNNNTFFYYLYLTITLVFPGGHFGKTPQPSRLVKKFPPRNEKVLRKSFLGKAVLYIQNKKKYLALKSSLPSSVQTLRT